MMKSGKMKMPKISVCIVTYNQENYIGVCLQSIFNQLINYDFEIIVGDDCSTDRTATIIKKFQCEFPGKIKLIENPVNLGSCANYKTVIKQAQGYYIIYIDGDDIMMPGKIDKQINFLINNSDCVAVVHKLKLIDGAGHVLNKTWPENFAKDRYNLKEIGLLHPLFGHSSIAFKRRALDVFLKKDVRDFIDMEIYLELAKQGLIGAINETLGFYRCSVGISSNNNFYKLAISAIDNVLLDCVDIRTLKLITANQYFIFAKKAYVMGNYTLFKNLIDKSYKSSHLSFAQRALYYSRHLAPFSRFFYLLKKWLSI